MVSSSLWLVLPRLPILIIPIRIIQMWTLPARSFLQVISCKGAQTIIISQNPIKHFQKRLLLDHSLKLLPLIDQIEDPFPLGLSLTLLGGRIYIIMTSFMCNSCDRVVAFILSNILINVLMSFFHVFWLIQVGV